MPGQFERVAADYFESSYRAFPTTATELGLHEYDDRLDDLSAEALRRHALELARLRRGLEAVDTRGLPANTATDHALILADLESTLLSIEGTCDWRRDPAYYVTAPLFAIFLVASRRDQPDRLANLRSRLAQLPEVLAAARTNLENPPHVLTEVAIEETEGAIEFCSGLVNHLAQTGERPSPRLQRAVEAAVKALKDYLHFLREELILISTGDPAIGREQFEAKLRVEHMLPYSLGEIRSIGRRVFEETERELEGWARRIDRTKSWRAQAEAARRQHPRRDTLLPAYRREVERLRRFTAEMELVSLPEEDCEVVETPPFDRALNSFAAYIAPGPFEREQRGQLWVTPVDADAPRAEQAEQLAEHCNFLYPITAAHEAYPGHHVQLMRANRVGSRWRKHFSASIFAEGWALYCEELMDEVGYYRDPRIKLFKLKDRLWRAARVLLDIGLHCEGMPLDQAARFLVDRVGLTPTAARAETRRYAAEPTQPLCYLLGQVEVLRLRSKFSRLSLREFHDLLLSSGTIPFSLVDREMEQAMGRGGRRVKTEDG